MNEEFINMLRTLGFKSRKHGTPLRYKNFMIFKHVVNSTGHKSSYNPIYNILKVAIL